MRSAKPKHRNKASTSAQIVRSMIGGSITNEENLSHHATTSLSSGPCKATLNRLDNGNNMLMLSWKSLGSYQPSVNYVYTPTLLKVNMSCFNNRLTNFQLLLPTHGLQKKFGICLMTNSSFISNAKALLNCTIDLMLYNLGITSNSTATCMTLELRRST